MPRVICKICKKDFYAKPSWLQHGWGKYCSRSCQYEGRKTGKIVNCYICKKPVYKSGKNLRGSKSKKYFCGKSCQTKWRNITYIGSKHGNWKNGDYAYRSILDRNGVTKICKLCRKKDERVLAVHHIDHNHSNNKLNNLTWLCHNCHFLVHHHVNEREKLMADVA